jgi:very-short-patch-repair endonuclease
MTGRQSRPPSDLTQSRAIELRAKASEIEKTALVRLTWKNAAGLKFRRQHPIEPYIADFYCAAANPSH